MIHFYTSRSHRTFKVKLLCGAWFALPEGDERAEDAVTVARAVTCSACLAILIPRQEKILAEMKANFRPAMKQPPPFTHQYGDEP